MSVVESEQFGDVLGRRIVANQIVDLKPGAMSGVQDANSRCDPRRLTARMDEIRIGLGSAAPKEFHAGEDTEFRNAICRPRHI
jgi:hypothetical protein